MSTNALVKHGNIFQLFMTMVYVSALWAVWNQERQKSCGWFWAQSISNPHDWHPFFTEEPNIHWVNTRNQQAKKNRFERPGFMSWRLLGNTQLPLRSLQDQRHLWALGVPQEEQRNQHTETVWCAGSWGVFVNLPSKHDLEIPRVEDQSTAFLLRQGKSCQPNYNKLFTKWSLQGKQHWMQECHATHHIFRYNFYCISLFFL